MSIKPDAEKNAVAFTRELSSFLDAETSKQAGILETRYSILKETVISGLEYDSRKVRPGFMYFALRGLHTDGHKFIADAVGRGASVVVCEELPSECKDTVTYIRVKDSRFAMSPLAASFYNHPSRSMAIIGVTGTEGKSTTVYLIYQLLKLLGCRAGFISTVMYGDGKNETPNPEHQTTPEAVQVHRMLAEMKCNGADFAVVEASSHGLSRRTNRLGDLAFDVGVMTNVTHEHLEFHGTWEQYRSDKAELFRNLGKVKKSHAEKLPCFGVVNALDSSALYFASAAEHKTYTFAVKESDADLVVKFIESGAGGNRYEVFSSAENDSFIIRDKLPGVFNAGNVLASLLAVSNLLGVSIREAAALVPELKPVTGRMTAVNRGQPFEVVIDYAHTPSSFQAVFPSLRERLNASGGRIISLFGSGGERDTAKRPEQGRIAAAYSDIVILSDEDPRGEVPMDILKQIAVGIENKTEGKDLFLIPDRPLAIRKAFSLARKGDLALLLGKGHENSIIYEKETVPYDETAEAVKALGELGFC
ncbi:MAG: UDP-N-acetylmuramoyl-L-alanyl-D-glutamate--2,6-diaminopimelate ligase [Treponema sp.]|jgi:UDP-N-acetylmuramoyl-L-alanyl-D-glutamate--2,6-diaminopimelate ligase|nr:UDP-N-acetylmuramoyl-L-alanyl-D-glutamate--2,6-diaminopimelate ligase [Treponema sp.]